ncbi:hypothetical protein [Spirosoma litoris]
MFSTSMLSLSITSTNSPIFRDASLQMRGGLFSWSRQVMVQFTVLLVGLFYMCAVLEVDLGNTEDSFGDVYDTYVFSTPVQAPKLSSGVYRKILPAQAVGTPDKRPIVFSVDWSFVFALVPLAFYVDKPIKRRCLQVVHAIWRL